MADGALMLLSVGKSGPTKAWISFIRQSFAQPRDNLQRKLATGNGRETVGTSRILEKLFRFVQRLEELLQHGAVFDGRDEGRFFVTLALNPEKAFR